MAPDTPARDHPNCSLSGLRNRPKHVWVPKEPSSKRNETATITQPCENRLLAMVRTRIISLQRTHLPAATSRLYKLGQVWSNGISKEQ